VGAVGLAIGALSPGCTPFLLCLFLAGELGPAIERDRR
jgi:hypothetical protein